jgi:mRNA-degrading endonuclease RelE of RelBE toxin-antitoxin system
MAFALDIVPSALQELKTIKPFYRRRIINAIEQQLRNQPSLETRNRKRLPGAKPDFEFVAPLWELRVERFRVFYDVNEDGSLVSIRAVREKPLHTATEEIL